MSPKWQDATIIVPAGVAMTRSSDGEMRTWTRPLTFKAHRAIDDRGQPTNGVWNFYWLSKSYIVSQDQVVIEELTP